MFFDVRPIPDWVSSLPLTIITESTYGYMKKSEIQYVFDENIIKATREKREILIPVFSFGRYQEVAYTIRLLQDKGLIDKGYPVYGVGKLGMKYTLWYKNDGLDNRDESRDFLPYDFQDISGNAAVQDEIIHNGKPRIILATGGMGSHGPSQDILPYFLPNKNAVIHFAGYCAEGTLGRKIYETWQGEMVEYNGIPTVEKNATIYFTNEFSKHAHQDELLHFLNQFENKLLVLTNHGEKESQKILSRLIETETYSKDVSIMGSYLYRINSHGLVKCYPNKYYSNIVY
jgi:metallo-beta-lactamase family protein